MHLTVLDNSMGCILGQQDETWKKEFAIYYLSKSSLIVSRGIPCWKRHVVLFPGREFFATVYVESHYLVDLQNGPNQVHF